MPPLKGSHGVGGDSANDGGLTILELSLGDVVRLRKPHPCGGYDWEVTRLGADIGLRCLRCGRRLMLERATLERRVKQFVSKAASDE